MRRPTTIDDHGRMVARLRAARETVAALVVDNPVYAPIFERLDIELAAEEAKGDHVARARAIVAAQRAMA